MKLVLAVFVLALCASLTVLAVPPARACEVDMDFDGFDACIDCDDFDPTIHPGAPEVPGDGIDQDCSGNDTCYSDADMDGYGALPLIEGSGFLCDGVGEASLDGDCDDTNADVNPSAPEIPNNAIDDDCDGQIDEGGVAIESLRFGVLKARFE